MIRSVLIAFIRLYRLVVSPFLAPCCRFHPSCSTYAMQAIERHGPWRGCLYATQRILKCHPFHLGGVDLVPTQNPDTRRT
jgi:putative membrane protein insertion efficiency factor